MTKKEAKINQPQKAAKRVISYSSAPVRLHAILKKLYIYVLRKRLAWWRGKRISFSNCPLKMKLFIAGKIKSKKVLKAFFIKDIILEPFVYEEKKGLSQDVKRICSYLKNNRNRANQETQKMAQILNNFKGIIPHLLRRDSHGVAKINAVLVKFYNDLSQNFLGQQFFSQQILNGENSDMQILLKSYQEKIQKTLKDRKEETSQEWERIKLDEQELKLDFKNYKIDEFELQEHKYQQGYVPQEEERINYMINFLYQLQIFLQGSGYLNTCDRKDTQYRCRPRIISTEILLEEQRQKQRKRNQCLFDDLLESPMHMEEEKIIAAQKRAKAAKRRQNIRNMVNVNSVEVSDEESSSSIQGKNNKRKMIKKQQHKTEDKNAKKQRKNTKPINMQQKVEKVQQMETQQGFFEDEYQQIPISPEILQKWRLQINDSEYHNPYEKFFEEE